MKRLFIALLLAPLVLCFAGNDKVKVSEKAEAPVYDTITGLEVGKAKFEATQDYLTMDMYITDGEPLTFFSNMAVTTDPDIRTLFPAAQLRVTDDKGRAHETITYGIAFNPDKFDSFQATLTAHTWIAGPVTLVPKTK